MIVFKFSRLARLVFVSATFIGVSISSNQLIVAEDWNVFRGPLGNGIAAKNSDVPTEWSREKNIAFRTPLPGEGWSSPVVANGRIYVSAAIPGDQNPESRATEYDLTLIVLDAKSGKILKSVPLMQQTAEKSPKIHKKNSHASPT
ncbi:MAG: PQQ-binding-like beta-propeller repeat protein, partial [Rhodopirellula bahusiensis]